MNIRKLKRKKKFSRYIYRVRKNKLSVAAAVANNCTQYTARVIPEIVVVSSVNK